VFQLLIGTKERLLKAIELNGNKVGINFRKSFSKELNLSPNSQTENMLVESIENDHPDSNVRI
jgi:hypothetical protein